MRAQLINKMTSGVNRPTPIKKAKLAKEAEFTKNTVNQLNTIKGPDIEDFSITLRPSSTFGDIYPGKYHYYNRKWHVERDGIEYPITYSD